MAFGYDGSIRIDTKLNSKAFKSGVDAMGSHFKNSIGKMMSSLGKLTAAIGIAFAATTIVNFGKESVKAASDLSSALIGLQSIMDGQGRSFTQAKGFIDSYIKDGLIPMQDAVTAYKNLAMRGYDTAQIEQTMIALKDASAFGRQASLTMGEAVSSATEGLKNENSILVDNAGVRKNVAKMWDSYAKSIGTNATSLTQQQKIQAEVNGIMEETRFQIGDAAKVSSTYAGEVAMLSFQFQQFKVALGEGIIPVAKAVIPGIRAIIAALTELAHVFAQVTALLFGGELKSPADDAMKDQVEAEGEVTEAGKDASGATDGLTDATEGMGDASKEAAKEMKGLTAGFDDINKLAGGAAEAVKDASKDLDTGLNIDKIGEGELFGGLEVSPEILDFVNKLKQAIQELADILGRIWDVFAAAWDKSGAKVIKAAKAALNSIWELLKAIGATFLKVWGDGAGEELLGIILEILTNILTFVSQLADQFKQVWDEMGQALVEAFFFALTSVLELVNSIGVAFAEAWNSGIGIAILETLMSILTGIFELVGVLAIKMREAWEANGNGVAIWQSILNVILDVLFFVDRLVSATVVWASGLNFEPIVSSFRQLLETLEPLVEVILKNLEGAYKNVLLPLAEWTIEEAAPRVVDLLSAAFEALTSIIIAMQPITQALMNKFIIPLAQWSGEIFLEAITSITEKLREFSDWATQNPGVIQAITTVIQTFFALFIASQVLMQIPKIIAMLGMFVDILKGTNLAAVGATAAVGLLIAGIVMIASVWEQMSGMEQVITILGALTAAALTAAIAVGIFQATASAGFAAAGIAAGIALIVAAIAVANRNASNISGAGRRKYSMSGTESRMYPVPNAPAARAYSVPKLAQGAVIPPPTSNLPQFSETKGAVQTLKLQYQRLKTHCEKLCPRGTMAAAYQK